MEASLRVWKSMPLLLICPLALIISFSQGQDSTNFLSIDCGLPKETGNYTDDQTGLTYISDESFIDTGVSRDVSADYLKTVPNSRYLRTVRSFPIGHNGTRNCYNLAAIQAKGLKYLIRATFLYGNYDGLNQAPTFELYLGVELWDTVRLNDSTTVVFKELVHIVASNYLYVCLVNLDTGTPFISALELRPLTNTGYLSMAGESMDTVFHYNFGAADPGKVIRYPDDYFDRQWEQYPSLDAYSAISNTSADINIKDCGYYPPLAAMRTAITPVSGGSISLSIPLPDPNTAYYFYMYVAEIEILLSNESRETEVKSPHLIFVLPSNTLPVNPQATTNVLISWIGSTPTLVIDLEESGGSNFPPILNAMELYSIKHFLQSLTDEQDVSAILNIKSTYGVQRDWHGDPCLPFSWDGLDCINSSDKNFPPRIISLNLSSSGLTGNVSIYISNLTFLGQLDLSNNNLTGAIPDFLADLSQLNLLYLSGNNFSGPIPQRLLDKAKKNLKLSVDGYVGNEPAPPNDCGIGQCNVKRSQSFVIPVVSVMATLVVFATIIVIIMLIRTKKRKGKANRKDGFIEPKNMQFTYHDILKMTNNFQRVLGKGGFGTVYHGLTTDGKQVAVKLLSSTSAQGYREFQTEAELLTRVHHRNLTSLIGYCNEDGHMSLVYEYMASGNLREHLSVTDDNVLSWSERLHIALDAAQGLDYLHNGCKPPIVHRDVKSTNILLTRNLEAKLADFGLSKAFTMDDGSHVSTRVVGTFGYLDPEYYATQRLNEKSDIYSFGIVILELITGRTAITGTDEKRHIVQWVSDTRWDIASVVDPKLEGMYDVESPWIALELARRCTSQSSCNRPRADHVLAELKKCLALQKVWAESQSTDESVLLEP